MTLHPDTTSRRATNWLLLATCLWGLSFPVMRALILSQEQLLPGRSSLFFSALCVAYRFALSAAVMLVFCAPGLRRLTRNEVLHGTGLGVFAGVGLLLQMDGLARIDASASAFLTQCYCVILPWWVAIRDRKWPSWRVVVAWILVVIGVAILARVEWRNIRLGRGELETLAASVAFAAQILWLERPRFAECRVSHSSLVMFGTISLVTLPVAAAFTVDNSDWLQSYQSASSWVFLLILVGACTLAAFVLMNRWQRHVGATLAAMIYSSEPIFASVFALFLPALFATWAGVAYPNETITTHLVVGGGLIFAANVLAQRKRDPVVPSAQL